MAEDFTSFDVNITTNRAIYNATPVSNRSQIIATTTDDFYPGVGGVAYVGAFGEAYYNTGFTFNEDPAAMGMTHSHEAGHQMGLYHDGTSELIYYPGHGNWGPIMGGPFYKSYVQWSRGQYPDANNQSENDLRIISNVLGQSPDDAGNTIATATPLTIPSENFEGYISPNGLTNDTDVYSFNITSGSRVSIEVATLLGKEGEYLGTNLAMSVSLKDSAGRTVAEMSSSDYSPLEPETNKFVFDSYLATGTYYLAITGDSPNKNWGTGFGEYANEGKFRISVVPSLNPTPNLTSPASGSTLTSDTATFRWKSNGLNPSYYRLRLGSTGPGSTDLLNKRFSGTVTRQRVTELPIDGRTIYARLSWKVDGNWTDADYTYTSAKAPSLSSPVDGAVLSGSSQLFKWNSGNLDIEGYRLKIGTRGTGSRNIFYRQLSQIKKKQIVNGIPTNGQELYVQLSWKFNGKWSSENYVYTTGR